MGILDTLKNAIFGTASQVKAGSAAGGTSATPSATTTRPAGAATATSAATPAPGAPSSPGPVDIEAVLKGMAARKTEKLNWQTSIVDLMKLVDLDPSLQNRKTLAGELGYTGDMQDSASMNIWLHQQVMQKLAAAGGTVPDSLRH